MFDTILGLPMHPLVVHGVVVLLPLMALVTVLVAARKGPRERWAWVVAVLDLGLVGMALVAKESGEALQRRLGVNVEAHEEIAEKLPLTAAALFGAAVLVALTRTNRRVGPIAVMLTMVAAIGVLWMTFRAGHTGAEAVWGSVVGAK
ncbi:MAG TPA: hypothetical protein P5181_12140 [Dermatophilaceae bacterium]|nr:hypothetical protein [Dermatophilaceae bacterium]